MLDIGREGTPKEDSSRGSLRRAFGSLVQLRPLPPRFTVARKSTTDLNVRGLGKKDFAHRKVR